MASWFHILTAAAESRFLGTLCPWRSLAIQANLGHIVARVPPCARNPANVVGHAGLRPWICPGRNGLGLCGLPQPVTPWSFVLAFVPRRGPMPFIDTSSLDIIERLPGWRGRYFHSPSMTFAHYDFVRGSSIHEHFHPQEEVYEVTEGELEVTIDGVAQIARAGFVAIVPGNVRHSVKALTDGRAIIVDYPLRRDFG
jgi:mannose-6-phosphate isomerase-like protein (cupin superfamily)